MQDEYGRPSFALSSKSVHTKSEEEILKHAPISQMEVATALSKSNLYLDVLSELERRVRFCESVVLQPSDKNFRGYKVLISE